ncbi:MAG TPA: hypothetical protein VG056_15750, partial [Pirellulales bacterium]|nr:hypothetical protein [Pirellulales bacterium]
MRRSATPHNPGVSLFPFLAVLICTMGVMMLLLVVCNRPGADGADDGPANGSSPAAATDAAIDVARNALSGKIAQLESSRKATETDLAERRRRLSAEEQRIHKLLEDWRSIQSATANFEQVEHAKGEALHLTESQIAQLEQAVKRAKEQAGLAAERARRQPPWFAIVPYEGPNGTRRRPIYIECGPDRVTLQPEGIVLTIEDFAGPDGPGNPLATILRAVRDYLAAGGAAGGPQGEPYPLLIVRPDGIELFYHARQAMASWATEFGYELIEQDRKLAYPPPNPQLAQIEQTALTDARARYAWFANTRTGRKEAAGARPMYRASVTGGGIVREGGASPDAEGGVATNDAPPLGQGSGVGGPRSALAGSAPGFAGPTSGFGNSGGGGFGDPRLAASQQASADGAPTAAFSGLNGAYHSSGSSNTAGFGGGPPGFGDGFAAGAAGGAFKGGPEGSTFAGSGIATGLPGGSVLPGGSASPGANLATGASGAGGALQGGPEGGMYTRTSAASGAPAGNVAPSGNFAGGIPSGIGAASGAIGSDGASGGDARNAGSASGTVNGGGVSGGGGGGGSGGNGGGSPDGAEGAAGGGVSITMNDDLRNR